MTKGESIVLTLENAAALAAAASIVVGAFDSIGGIGTVHVRELTDAEATFLAQLKAIGLIEIEQIAGRESLSFISDLIDAITKVSEAVAPRLPGRSAGCDGRPVEIAAGGLWLH